MQSINSNSIVIPVSLWINESFYKAKRFSTFSEALNKITDKTTVAQTLFSFFPFTLENQEKLVSWLAKASVPNLNRIEIERELFAAILLLASKASADTKREVLRESYAYARRYPDILEEAGFTLSELNHLGTPKKQFQIYFGKPKKQKKKKKPTAKQAFIGPIKPPADPYTEKLSQEIRPLTPTKRLDAILKDERAWSKRPHLLAELGITLDDLAGRKQVILERAEKRETKTAAQKFIKKEQNLEQVKTQTKTLEPLGFQIEINEEKSRPVILTGNFQERLLPIDPLVQKEILYAIRKRFSGFTDISRGAEKIKIEGSPETLLKHLADLETLRTDLEAIWDLEPWAISTINKPDAARLAGISTADFSSIVEAGLIAVAETESFRKWGKTLVAQKFHLRDALHLHNSPLKAAFLEKRARKIEQNRKKGAKKAIATKERRKVIAKAIKAEERKIFRSAVQITGELTSALHLELFHYAQRASSLSFEGGKTAEEALQLKATAIECLHDNNALSFTFIPSHRTRLNHKCKKHAQGWYHYDDLRSCKKCQFDTDDSYAFYHAKLTKFPTEGELNLSYEDGQYLGFPNKSVLSKHQGDIREVWCIENRQEEAEIFTLSRVKKEILRLTKILNTENEGAEEDEEGDNDI